MDLNADSGTVPTHTTEGGSAMEQELSLSGARCQAESGGNILLELSEYKTQLLEAVRELHIRRDAMTRFEGQMSKLVLEKQELEWEKESLQDQIKTMANQHAESLLSAKKEFQAKMRNTEEEKGKYQVSAELKDKENNNLKEELKSLQLLKYNLEKKSSELEQKLALQSRFKDSHLNQLGEVEKRFSALSRRCAAVKQAHEKLEQNVDEAIKMNHKLTLANENIEATVLSLKKELEEVSNKLVKAKMSSISHNKTQSPPEREQLIQQLQQKLNMETVMNKRLREENEGAQVAKQEVMKCLQNTQQLLLSQTQAVNRVEIGLQKEREQHQALKQEHEVMREKSKATDDKVARLMESYTTSRTCWDKERATFLDQIKSEQQHLQAVKQAYDDLQQKHTELASQAEVHKQCMCELETSHSRDSVSNQEEVRGEVALLEPVSSSGPHGIDRLTTSAWIINRGQMLDATTAVGGQGIPDHLQQSNFKEPPMPFVTSFDNDDPYSHCSVSGTTDSVSNVPNKTRRDLDIVSELTNTISSVFEVDLLMNQDSSLTDTSAVATGTVDPGDEGSRGISEKGKEGEDEVKQCKGNREEEEDSKDKTRNDEKSEALIVQTTDRADGREDSQRSTDDAKDTKRPETETKDRAEEEGTDEAEGRAKTGPDMPETQIPVQTNTDSTTEMSGARQVVDFMGTESPSVACESLQRLCERSEGVHEEDVESKGNCPDHQQSDNQGPSFEINQGEVQVVVHISGSPPQLTNPVRQNIEKTPEKKPDDQLATNISTELSEPVNGSTTCLSNASLDGNVTIQESEKNTTQRQPSDSSDNNVDMKQTDELCSSHVGAMVEPQPQETSEQQSGLKNSLITDDEDDHSSACERMKVQSHVSRDTQEALEESKLKDVDSVDPGSEMRTVSSEQIEDTTGEKTNKHDSDLKLSVHLSHGNRASPETDATEPGKETQAPSLPSNTYTRLFDWSSSRRKMGLSMSVQTTNTPSGLSGLPASTMTTLFKHKQKKVPLVITRASDLLNASSVCGTTASSRRLHQGETCGETAAANTERTSLPITYFPISTSSTTVSRLSWQTTSGCSRAPASAAGPGSEPDLEPSCSQEREDQQSSFRAQISKIEQFLNAERLHFPKRRKTEN